MFLTNLKTFGLYQKQGGSKGICCFDIHFAHKAIDWKNCVGECIYGLASMTRIHSGVIKQVLEREQAKRTHCFLHKENLATRQMSREFLGRQTTAPKMRQERRPTGLGYIFSPSAYSKTKRKKLNPKAIITYQRPTTIGQKLTNYKQDTKANQRWVKAMWALWTSWLLWKK